MKVGLLNLQHSQKNYGAVLQASALESVVRELNHEVTTINFVPYPDRPQPKSFKNSLIKILKSPLPKHFVRDVKHRLSPYYVFTRFRKDWLNVSKREFNNATDLKYLENEFDALIVGSDQVWRTEYTKPYRLSYFLDFAGANTRRIAYAASFGLDRLSEDDPKLLERIRPEVKRFHSISVREDSGVSICRSELKVDATHVLDPTLLRGRAFFDEIIESENLKLEYKGLPYYKLDSSQSFLDEINAAGKVLNCSSINLYEAENLDSGKFVSVFEWLARLREAKFIVTDSYHCVCFAILFEKDFVCIANPERGISRIESLLSALGLKSQIVNEDIAFSQEIDKYTNIDYKKVTQKISELRIQSLAFLKASLL